MAYIDNLYDELRSPLPQRLDELLAKREEMRQRLHDGEPGSPDWELKSRYIADLDTAINRAKLSDQRRAESPVKLPVVDRSLLEALLTCPESDLLDWKRDFPKSLIAGSKDAGWDSAQGDVVKDIVAIANSVLDTAGFVVYGVQDLQVSRNPVGVSRSWDEAQFQTWLEKTVSPPVTFTYGEVEWQSSVRVGVVAVVPAKNFPHVIIQDLGSCAHAGQVWFRRGSKNTVALFDDLKRMFTTQSMGTRIYESLSDPSLKVIEEGFRKTGREPVYLRVDQRDSKIEQGYEIARHPQTGQEMLVGRNFQGDPELVVMLRPRDSR